VITIMVRFRDENGKFQRGELANNFRIMVEPCGEVLYIDQENPAEIDVLTTKPLGMHRIPTLAVIDMKEVVPA
jgi:hypothetical protein